MKKQYKHYCRERHRGYGLNLYRNVKQKKIAGVCAGLADHFEVAHWVMRIAFIAGFLFTGGVVFWGYILAWVALSPNLPEYYEESMEYDEASRRYRKKNMFRYGESSSVRIRRAKDRLKKAMSRVEEMEQYVTSRKFKLDREFADLERR